jgi:CubicO group peptidase (beta-lactamase class C family)
VTALQLLIIGGAGLLCAAAAAAPARGDSVDDFVLRQMRRQHVPGLSLAVVKDGKLVKAKGYGLANVETRAPATTRTVYQIQSMTKPFTAMAVMLLEQEGRLGLEDPVGRYLPGAPDAWKGITLRHLLTHTSGIKDYINEPTQSLRLDVADEEVFRAAAPRPLNFQPGQRYAYSNTNYHLLGMIIHKLSGKPYGEFLRERVFEPLGMNDTRVLSLTEVIPNRASGYVWEGGALRNGDYVAGSVLAYAGGGLRSTVLDLAKWDAALHSGKLLKREILERMWAAPHLNDGSQSEYGFGWGLGQARGHRFVSHTGGHLTGFTTIILRYPDDGLTVVALTNQRGGSNPNAIARGVANLYLPGIIAPAPPRAKAEPARYRAFAGRYEFANNVMLTVTEAKGRLHAAFPGQEPEEVLPASADSYFFEDRDVVLTFLPGPGGDSGGLTARTRDEFSKGEPGRRVPRIGPLVSAIKSSPDPDPALTRVIEETVRAIARGGAAMEAATGIATESRSRYVDGVAELLGITPLTYVGEQDVAGRGIERHGSPIARVRFYRVAGSKASRALLIHLTAAGLIADYDLVED